MFTEKEEGLFRKRREERGSRKSTVFRKFAEFVSLKSSSKKLRMNQTVLAYTRPQNDLGKEKITVRVFLEYSRLALLNCIPNLTSIYCTGHASLVIIR